jgi:hypothetical protein
MSDEPKKQRVFSITISGFDPARFKAPSAGAARYAAFKAWKEAGYGRGWSFGDFLHNCTTLHMGRAPEAS